MEISKWFPTWEKEGKWFRGIRNMRKRVTHLSETNKGPLKLEGEQKVDRRGGESEFPSGAIFKGFYTWEKEGEWFRGIRNMKKRVTHLSKDL